MSPLGGPDPSIRGSSGHSGAARGQNAAFPPLTDFVDREPLAAPPGTSSPAPRSGPLAGLRVVEMAGLGPAPFAAMMLADHGAEVVRIDRPQSDGRPAGALGLDARFDLPARSRARCVALNLRTAAGVESALQLIDSVDVLIEGYRPGVMERLGLGPQVCLQRNPRLVYGRMTGWGQDGPLAHAAGHDLNYAAVTGALGAIGSRSEPPPPPLNYLADYGGGAMMLAFGVLAAVLEARQAQLAGRPAQGQVVDAAMVDGLALMSVMFQGMRAAPMPGAALGARAGQRSSDPPEPRDGVAGHAWIDEREANLIDGGNPFYRCYRCADGRFVAVGALEQQFRDELLRRMGLAGDLALMNPDERARWPAMRARLADHFARRTRDDWCRVLEGTDACFAPVLGWDEAPEHAHLKARGTFVTVDGIVQAAPAPRFSRHTDGTPLQPPRARFDEPGA
jgi:alpha-methylacyl-CoA racemase